MVHLVLASDRSLIRQLGITALSAVHHASAPLRFTFLTPASDATAPDWATVLRTLGAAGANCELVPVAFDGEHLQMAAHLTHVTYYRLLLPQLLDASCDRVIYLDCDVFVGRDVCQLWNVELGDSTIAAVEDRDFHAWDRIGLDPTDGYFNAGVLLIDLDRVRKTGAFSAAMDDAVANPGALTWSDQCALNRVLTRQWLRLDMGWNYQNSQLVEDVAAHGVREVRAAARGRIVHFNNYNKPWLFEAAHPLKGCYLAVSKAHPELNPLTPGSLGGYLVRLRRAIKWQLLGAGVKVG